MMAARTLASDSHRLFAGPCPRQEKDLRHVTASAPYCPCAGSHGPHRPGSLSEGNPYLTLRETLGTIFDDADFATLFPICGQPSLPPWRLALVTIMQFRENLADRHAAEAVRARIDWKYLLSLE